MLESGRKERERFTLGRIRFSVLSPIPRTAAKSADEVCVVCGTVPQKVKRCMKCHRAVYCSKDCQRQHWRAEHRAFHQERNMTIAAALGRGGLPADAQGEVRGC